MFWFIILVVFVYIAMLSKNKKKMGVRIKLEQLSKDETELQSYREYLLSQGRNDEVEYVDNTLSEIRSQRNYIVATGELPNE